MSKDRALQAAAAYLQLSQKKVWLPSNTPIPMFKCCQDETRMRFTAPKFFPYSTNYTTKVILIFILVAFGNWYRSSVYLDRSDHVRA